MFELQYKPLAVCFHLNLGFRSERRVQYAVQCPWFHVVQSQHGTAITILVYSLAGD